MVINLVEQVFYRFSTPESVDEWVKIHYTQEEINRINIEFQDSESALSEYKGNYSKVINYYVRKELENNQNTYNIAELQAFLFSRIIEDNIEVYRFVSLAELFALWKNTIRGKIYTYPNFLSTTMLKKYYSMMEIKYCRLPIIIRIRKGTPGTYIPEVNVEMPEFEILIPYRSKLKRINLTTYEIVI